MHVWLEEWCFGGVEVVVCQVVDLGGLILEGVWQCGRHYTNGYVSVLSQS